MPTIYPTFIEKDKHKDKEKRYFLAMTCDVVFANSFVGNILNKQSKVKQSKV